MHKFVRNFITEWRRLGLSVAGSTIVAAVSGGADSVSVLLALNELRLRGKLDLRLVAAHFNHRLRGDESDADEEYVRHLTTSLGIEFDAGGAKIESDGNLEQIARDARYAFLARAADNVGAFAVVTGHTVNDQAETFLLNLIRGSGVEGLSGMKSVRELEQAKRRKPEKETGGMVASELSPFLPFSSAPVLLVRPLLSWAKRLDTEGFCHDCEVEYRYDTMNEDTAFKRVRIRKVLLPLLEDLDPRIVETLARTAALMQDVVKRDEPAGRSAAEHLLIKDMKLLPKTKIYNTIRSWLRQRRGTTRGLQLKHIQAIERLVFSEKSGKTAELPGGSVTKTAGKLVYEENKVEN